MKINGLLILSLITLLTSASRSLGADFTDLESAIAAAKEPTSENSTLKSFHWLELETFHSALWRSMALDPSAVVPVPPNQVPKNLFANELNAELSLQLSELKKNPLPKEFHVEAEFSQYLTVVQNLLLQRQARQFPQVRAFAKRGRLDDVFLPLQKKLSSVTPSHGSNLAPALLKIEEATQALKAQLTTPPKDNSKKEVFGNGTQFIWYMVTAIFGFFFGLAGYRMNPDFFQKFLDQFDSNAPTATTHSAGAQKLDYARWLREFEEILSRLKSSQSTLERRIEDIVQNSEKITQHSLSLYADARIKNEANLEYRMASLVRDVQNQFAQSQKLQAGDRVQVNLMLEHCMKLCDAIEMESIHLDRVKLSEIPEHRSA